MKKATFKIRRKILLAFLFCFLSVLVFALLSFQVHREISHRLRLVEVADDLFNNILEMRRFEKNFFLYKQPQSLEEAILYAQRVRELYLAHEQEILKLAASQTGASFLDTLSGYGKTLAQIQALLSGGTPGTQQEDFAALEDSLRTVGQRLLDVAGQWAKEERLKIDSLFRRAQTLFVASVLFFGALGLVVAAYISRMMTRPLVRMQQAMEKIAGGDFTPVSEEGVASEEFLPLFRAFNRMIHELEERQEQLVQARKISAIGTFTSGIAHELNNPVNNIVLTAETLREDYDALSREETLEMLQDIIVQSERASEIIRNLLDFSRAERPEMLSLSLAPVIENTLKLVRNQMLLSGVEEHVEIPDDLPTVCGDYKSLQQVFLNLFLNAVHAMPRGGMLTVKCRASQDRAWVRAWIIDTGTGIEADLIPRIFDPFFTTKEVGKGTGLGLSVTYGILQKHGGTIEVQSEKEKGTTFTVSLPAEQEESCNGESERPACA